MNSIWKTMRTSPAPSVEGLRKAQSLSRDWGGVETGGSITYPVNALACFDCAKTIPY